MGKVILPINYLAFEGPLIFLGGPIAHAPNWQKNAINIIQSLDSKINIACPNEKVDSFYYKDNPLRIDNFSDKVGEWPQVDWERFYLKQALDKGTILFWLSKQLPEYIYQPIGLNTRFELGKYSAIAELTGKKVCVGIEDNFIGGNFIRTHLMNDTPNTQIAYTLEKTCEKAIEMARKNNQ